MIILPIEMKKKIIFKGSNTQVVIRQGIITFDV